MKPHLKVIYDILVAAARAGRPSPTNAQLAKMAGIEEGALRSRIQQLIKLRHIESITSGSMGVGSVRKIVITELGISTRPQKSKSIWGCTPPAPTPEVHGGALKDAIQFLRSKNIKPVVSMAFTDEGGPEHLFKVERAINLTAEQVIARANEIKSWRAAS